MENNNFTKDKSELIDTDNSISVQLEQNELKYILNIKTKENEIIFIAKDKNEFPFNEFTRKIDFNEIKELNEAFNLLKSINDFFDFLKKLSDKKKIGIQKFNDKIFLILYVEILLEQKEIKIELTQIKKEIDTNIQEIYFELINIKNNLKDNSELKKEIDFLKNDNKELRKIIQEQNKEINALKDTLYNFMNKSVIMSVNDKSYIITEIENKMNKKIKQLKKLYQATIDGGDPENFHLKCDNIPNTLVLIKSEGNRKFGGFTPIPWKSEGDYLDDKEMKTFVFSLDNKEIYSLKENNKAVFHSKNNGPCFGYGPDIGIIGNPINEKKLHTIQSSFDYLKSENNYLLEKQGRNLIKAFEYEVFEVIFN